MNYQTLLIERHESWVKVGLNRPEKLNAFDRRLLEDLTAAAAHIGADPTIRSVLLTGSGRAFCSGADLGQGGWSDAPGASPGQNVGARLRSYFNPMILAWYELPRPVVVAVNGVAAGAGASLALMGDIVLAARSASFVQLFAPKLGLIPDLGSTFFLPRLVGSARAKGLAMLGEPLSADDAHRWGLIWESIADDELLPRATRLAENLAKAPTQALRKIKEILGQEPPATLRDALEREAAAQEQLGDSADFAEGVAAFRQKRIPRFEGK